MEQKNTKKIVLSSLIWKLLERSGVQGVQFIVQIILARLLMPKDFGTIAIVMVFISFANIIVQRGFNTALIQKKNVDINDYSSVLFLSLFASIIVYLIIFFAAKYIGLFYNDLLLTSILRVLAITIFFGSINSIQIAYISKNMMFKTLFRSSLISIIISGIVGIFFAYSGFGVWAIVIQQLSYQILVSITMWFNIPLRPKFVFSIKRIKTLFSFGWNILISSLLETLYNNLRVLLVGKIYTPTVLGFYSKGQQFPRLIVENINGSISSVMLPTLSAEQENKVRIKEIMRRSIVTSAFVIFPMMIGLVVVAEQLVRLILTDKWLSAVTFIRIFSISYALMPIHTANLQAINAVGRSDIYLKVQIVKKVIGLIILGITLYFGVIAIAIGQAVSGLISLFINTYPNKKLLNYSYKEQCLDILPSLLTSILMGGLVFLINLLSISSTYIIILQVVSGFFIYVALAKLFKIESLSYIIGTIKQLITTK